jgi:DNA-binding transcriptional MerR regulator
MRIGDLSARTGVNTATLRAWERRHGILQPVRTAGGHRVYTEEDARRVRAVTALVQRGASLSEAVERLSRSAAAPAGTAEARAHLWEAIDAFDERATMEVLSAAVAAAGIPAHFDEILVPVLRRLGEEWRQSPRNVAREHFASMLVRSHLASLLPVHLAQGQPCLAFCPEGERHDIGLLMAAATVASTGRQVIVLGAQTPAASIEALGNELRPAIVLVATSLRRPAVRFLDWWRPQRGTLTLAGGAGFRSTDAARLGGRLHTGPYREVPGLIDAKRS